MSLLSSLRPAPLHDENIDFCAQKGIPDRRKHHDQLEETRVLIELVHQLIHFKVFVVVLMLEGSLIYDQSTQGHLLPDA